MKLLLKILIIIVAIIIILIGGTYLYLVPLGGTESVVNSKIESEVNKKYDLEITVGEIKGDVFSGIILENIEINYDDDSLRYRMATIPRITAEYSIRNLINENFIFERLQLDSAEITIKKDKEGNYILPKFRSKQEDDQDTVDTTGSRFPGFDIEELFLNKIKMSIESENDTLVLNDVTALLSVKSEESTVSADVRQFSFRGNKQLYRLDASEGKITLTNKTLVLKDFILISNKSRLKLDGIINLEDKLSGNISINADHIDLAGIGAMGGPNLEGVIDLNGDIIFEGQEFAGSIDIGGEFLFMSFENLFVDFAFEDKVLSLDTVYGSLFGNSSIDGAGFINFGAPNETYRMSADIRQFNLKNLLPNTFYSDLNGRVVLDGESFRNKDLKLNLSVELFESTFDEYPLQEASGDFIVTTDSILFADSFTVKYYENLFYASGKVDYSHDMHLDITAYLDNLDRYKGKFFIDDPGGRAFAEATLSGATSDPDLVGYFVSDSLWLYGLYADSFYADIDIERFLSGKQGYVESRFFEGTAWSIPYDTGYSYVSIDSHLVSLDSTYLENRFSSLTGRGLFNYGETPALLTLDTFEIDLSAQYFYNQGSIEIAIDSLGFLLHQAAIGNNGHWMAANGRINYDETMDMVLSVKNIPIAPWMALYEDTLIVDGILSTEANLQGSFMEPVFSMQTQIDSLQYKSLQLGDVTAVMSYDDRILQIDSTVVLSNPGFYKAVGTMAIDLAFTADSLERFPDRPMDIHITAKDSRFDLVSFMLPSVEEVEGNFTADFELSGSPMEPHLEGEAAIKGYYADAGDDKLFIPASLKYFDLEEYIYTDSAKVRMTNNQILIDSINAYLYEKRTTPEHLRDGAKGRKYSSADISGMITIKSFDNFNYDLDVELRQYPRPVPFTYSLDNISGHVFGHLEIQGDTPPWVTGDITLPDVKYYVNFAQPNEGSPIMQALVGENSWNLDIDIIIPSKYFIKNEDIDAEFAGEINLTRENGVYKFAGYMEILRGKGYLVDKTFRLDPGGTVVFEGDDEFNPTLDITGYTRVRTAGTIEGESQSSEVKNLGIQISGTLEEPIITPTEDSDFGSTEDIMLAIFANIGSDQSVGQLGAFDQRAYDLLSVQLSRIVSRQVGVETFEIDPMYTEGSLDPLKSRVTVGSYLDIVDPNLYLYGSASTERVSEAGFEYRMSKEWMLQGLRDEDGLYHLNIRWNWEFE